MENITSRETEPRSAMVQGPLPIEIMRAAIQAAHQRAETRRESVQRMDRESREAVRNAGFTHEANSVYHKTQERCRTECEEIQVECETAVREAHAAYDLWFLDERVHEFLTTAAALPQRVKDAQDRFDVCMEKVHATLVSFSAAASCLETNRQGIITARKKFDTDASEILARITQAGREYERVRNVDNAMMTAVDCLHHVRLETRTMLETASTEMDRLFRVQASCDAAVQEVDHVFRTTLATDPVLSSYTVQSCLEQLDQAQRVCDNSIRGAMDYCRVILYRFTSITLTDRRS